MILVPRATVFGAGVLPTNTSGSPRPPMAANRPYLTIHYTGAGLWLDPDDTPTELRAIQAYAKSAGKPWEYNWVIDGQGIVWEYAGDYRAAHSQGDNEMAIGVLLLVGLNQAVPPVLEEPPPPMIQAVRDLRAWLLTTDRLAENHQMLQHRQMPGANTSCPGAQVIAHWSELTAPATTDPPTPPTPIPPIGDDMLELVVPNQRVYDSRNVGQLGPNEIRTINLGPAAVNAIAAHINLTITAPVAAGHAVMFGTAQPPPTSNINFVAAETISNAGVVQVTGGAINVRASVACHVILDVQAVYKP